MRANIKTATKKLAIMAVLAALSVVMVLIIRVPLIPSAPFLEYDMADIPILVGAFSLGPMAGLALTVVASVIQGFTVSASSGLYGIIMHVIATGVFVTVAGLIYRWKHSFTGALIALVSGVLITSAVMMGANLLVTPYFMGASVSAVRDMLLPAILPFNLLKLGINAAATLMVYKPLSRLFNLFLEGRRKQREGQAA